MGVGVGVGVGVGAGVGEGVGAGVGEGVGAGVGKGVGTGVGAAVTSSVGEGNGSVFAASVKRSSKLSFPSAVSPEAERLSEGFESEAEDACFVPELFSCLSEPAQPPLSIMNDKAIISDINLETLFKRLFIRSPSEFQEQDAS